MARQSAVTLWIQIRQQGAEAIKAVKDSVKEFGNSIFDLKALAIEAAAVLAEQFGEKLVKAFAESEQGIIKLNAALRVSGRYSDEGTDKIQAMAEKMSHLTDVSRDAGISVSATLAQYTRTLTPDQLANLQQAVIGLHALTGQDVESAAMRVARALEGQGNSLKRVGVEIDNTMTEQQRYSQIMEKLGPQFKIAEEMNNSLMGQMTQFGHATEELRKQLGQVIIESFNLTTVGPSFTKTIEGWTKSIADNLGTWIHWGAIIFAVIKSFGQVIVFVVRDIWNFGQITYAVLKGIVLTLWDFVGVFKQGAILIKDYFVATWDDVKLGAEQLYNAAVGILNMLIEKFNTVSPIKLPLFDQIQADSTEAIKAAAGVQDQWDKFTDVFHQIGGVWKDVWGSIKVDLGDLDDNAQNLQNSYQRILDLWNAPVRPNAAFGDPRHAGGGANLGEQKGDDPTTAMRNLQQALKKTKQEWDDNTISTSDYVSSIAKLAPRIKSVMDSLSGEHLVAFSGEVGNLQKELNKLGYTYENGSVRMLSVAEALNLKMREATKTAGTLNIVIANMAMETFKGFFTAIQAAFTALIDGSKSAGAAFADAMLGALAAVAQGFGEFFLGRAAAAIAEALLPSNVVTGLSAGGIGAAAKFTAAAAAMFALSGILGGLSKGGGGSGGGGGGAAGAQQQTNAVTNNQQPGTIVIEGGLLDMSDPRQADALADAINTLKDRRIIIQAG